MPSGSQLNPALSRLPDASPDDPWHRAPVQPTPRHWNLSAVLAVPIIFAAGVLVGMVM
ncbi:hypothetical protein [Neotabrizicola shimadae]|uniref:Uncharacterized protein n=1 Tax=Neotabrizicola shimadae TaxID=2807096 RepID=A0A8G0ZTZ5_9RHOB|nr:hypothetical protein [Neotabrizicola shimadae]QYZ70037.1 hypothetical protein JO391_00370 [Neotabrizicola shimadae]